MILHGDGSTNIFVKDGLLPFSQYVKESSPNVLHDSKDDALYQDKSVNGNFDLILTIIWSPELYKNNMVTHSFPCLLSSYLLRNVKIAQREL